MTEIIGSRFNDKTGKCIKIGNLVTWISQAQGYEKTKTGEVLAWLPKNSDMSVIFGQSTGISKSRIKGQNVSQIDRILVRVSRNNGFGSDFYTPRPGQVEVIES